MVALIALCLPKNIRYSLLFISFFIIFHANSYANDINIDYDWYHYQGAPDASMPSYDCGPACVSMIIHFVKQQSVPINEIRSYIDHDEGTGVGDVTRCLDHWGVSYGWHKSTLGSIISSLNKGHILLCGMSMKYLSKGEDIDGESDDPNLNRNRYNSYNGDHWIIIKGISRDEQWVIVNDPNVFGTYPYPKFWYSNGTPKGKDRYYNVFELDKAMIALMEIDGGLYDSVSKKFLPSNNIIVSQNNGVELKASQDSNDDIIKIIPKGTIGRIVSDSKNGRYFNGAYWWHVRFGDIEGWCAEDKLEIIKLSTAQFLTVSGEVSYSSDGRFAPNGLDVIAIDEDRRFYVTTTTGEKEHGKYSITLANQYDVPVATEGYYMRVIIKDCGYIIGTQTHVLTSDDIANLSAVINVTIGDYAIPEKVDINNDGLLNNLDLIRLGMNFNKRGNDLAGDLNNDGCIELDDLIELAEYLYDDIPNPSMDNSVLIKRIYDVLLTAINPSMNLKYLIKKLEPYIVFNATMLFPNYPNPCNPGTWIPFKLANDGEVSIIIHNVFGKRIRVIKLGNLPEGRYTIEGRAVYWDGCNETGESVTSGVYFYTLIAGGYKETRCLVVLR